MFKQARHDDFTRRASLRLPLHAEFKSKVPRLQSVHKKERFAHRVELSDNGFLKVAYSYCLDLYHLTQSNLGGLQILNKQSHDLPEFGF